MNVSPRKAMAMGMMDGGMAKKKQVVKKKRGGSPKKKQVMKTHVWKRWWY